RQVEPVPLGDLAPVGHAGAAQRVCADAHARGAHGVQVEHVGQRVDVGAEEVVAAGGLGGQRPRVGDAADLLEPVGDQRVGAVLDPGGGLGVGRAAVRRVVLETAVTGRVVRGGHHHAVGQTGGAAPVVGEDRQGDRGGRGVAVAGVEHDAYAVGGE